MGQCVVRRPRDAQCLSTGKDSPAIPSEQLAAGQRHCSFVISGRWWTTGGATPACLGQVPNPCLVHPLIELSPTPSGPYAFRHCTHAAQNAPTAILGGKLCVTERAFISQWTTANIAVFRLAQPFEGLALAHTGCGFIPAVGLLFLLNSVLVPHPVVPFDLNFSK